MKTYISGNDRPRMEMLVELAKKIDNGLDRVDAGDPSFVVMLARGNRTTRITIEREMGQVQS